MPSRLLSISANCIRISVSVPATFRTWKHSENSVLQKQFLYLKEPFSVCRSHAANIKYRPWRSITFPFWIWLKKMILTWPKRLILSVRTRLLSSPCCGWQIHAPLIPKSLPCGLLSQCWGRRIWRAGFRQPSLRNCVLTNRMNWCAFPCCVPSLQKILHRSLAWQCVPRNCFWPVFSRFWILFWIVLWKKPSPWYVYRARSAPPF